MLVQKVVAVGPEPCAVLEGLLFRQQIEEFGVLQLRQLLQCSPDEQTWGTPFIVPQKLKSPTVALPDCAAAALGATIEEIIGKAATEAKPTFLTSSRLEIL